MRKSEKTTFQWPKVSKWLTTLPRHRANIRTGLRFLFRAPEVTFLKWRKAVKVAFSHSQNGHFWCPKQKSETCSDITSTLVVKINRDFTLQTQIFTQIFRSWHSLLNFWGKFGGWGLCPPWAHFHKRVGETPVHWLPSAVGPTPGHCSVPEYRPLEYFQRSDSV